MANVEFSVVDFAKFDEAHDRWFDWTCKPHQYGDVHVSFVMDYPNPSNQDKPIVMTTFERRYGEQYHNGCQTIEKSVVFKSFDKVIDLMDWMIENYADYYSQPDWDDVGYDNDCQ